MGGDEQQDSGGEQKCEDGKVWPLAMQQDRPVAVDKLGERIEGIYEIVFVGDIRYLVEDRRGKQQHLQNHVSRKATLIAASK